MTEILIPIAQIALSIALILVAILCLRLDGKLNALRKGSDGVGATTAGLNDTVKRAEAAVKALRGHTDGASDALQAQIDEAKALADKLTFLTSAARALNTATPQATTRAPEPKSSRDWDDDDFVPARSQPDAQARWGGLR
jgi:uncharacterized protein YoxC